MVNVENAIREFRAAREEAYNGTKAWISKVEGTATQCLQFIASNEGYRLVHVHANGNYCFGLKCQKEETK